MSSPKQTAKCLDPWASNSQEQCLKYLKMSGWFFTSFCFLLFYTNRKLRLQTFGHFMTTYE